MTTLPHVPTENIDQGPSDIPKVLSSPTVPLVQAHLVEMKAMYDLQTTSSPLEMYAHLLAMEADYCDNIHMENYAHTVHKLHPVQYAQSNARHLPARRSLKAILTVCPYSGCPVSVEDSYQLHIQGKTVVCQVCTNPITMDMYKMNALLDAAKTMMPELAVPTLPHDGQFESFLD
ncbi:hypothetical protein As57867_023284, partial [Aphanomyces stellatus]